MKEQNKRKGGGSKLARTETVTVRLDPKLRYLAELAARKQRRTLSSFIEWVIENALRQVVQGDGVSVAEMAGTLWDVDESERFVRLAINCPDLLTYEEQEKWKILNDSDFFCPARQRDPYGNIKWSWAILEDEGFPKLRKVWHSMNEAYNEGEDAIAEWILIHNPNIPF